MLLFVNSSLLISEKISNYLNQGSAVGRDQNGIPVPGFGRDRDSLFQIFLFQKNLWVKKSVGYLELPRVN